MSVTIYHNPRCSKSRQTLQLLKENGIEPRIVEYLKEPPDAATLKRLVRQLNLSARDLLRPGEAVYKELKLADPGKSEDEIIAAIVENPILLERPIVVKEGKAVLGRPPENALKLL